MLISALLFSIFCFIPSGKYICNEKYSDNNYNNAYLSEGNLVRIDDKLYYNYDPNDSVFRYGLYEISQDGNKRIYWDGPSFEPGNNLFKMQVHNDYLLASDYDAEITSQSVSSNGLLSQFNGNIYFLDLQNNAIEKLYSLKNDEIKKFKYFYIIDGSIYIFTDKSIYISEDGVNITKVFDKLNDVVNKTAYEKLCYISNEKLLYINDDLFLIEYDMKSQKEVSSINLSEISTDIDAFRDVFVCDNKIIVSTYENSSFEAYAIDSDIKQIYKKTHEPYYYINSYNDKILVSSPSGGLDVLDVRKTDIENLVPSGVCDTYIIDDEWVYYVNSKGALCRINNKSNESEKVFG